MATQLMSSVRGGALVQARVPPSGAGGRAPLPLRRPPALAASSTTVTATLGLPSSTSSRRVVHPLQRAQRRWRPRAGPRRGAALRAVAAEGGEGEAAAAPFVVPTFLNNTPHDREIRKVFYNIGRPFCSDATAAVVKAVNAGVKRMKVSSEFPELNTEMDVYRVGTMLELIRTMANALAQDGKRVRVCVQGSMGKGVFQALPLTLSGVRRIMDLMDWGEGMAGEFIFTGAIGAEEAKPEDDVFILISPSNIVGHSILPPLQEMLEVVGDRPVIVFNPKMTDIPSAGGVMQVQGRQGRLDFVKQFEPVYHFRLLYNKPYFFPIYGALRYSYGEPWEIFRRDQISRTEEVYTSVQKEPKEPTPAIITKAIRG